MNELPPLFDVNGWIGLPFNGEPEFATASDLLAHMDRLGVNRSLMWHVIMRDMHAPTGNRRLLEEIDAAPGARDRLIPAFSISPSMLYEKNGVAEYQAAFQSGRVRAIRLLMAGQKLSWDLAIPLVEPVATHRPVVLTDVRSTPDLPGAVRFAERFPDIPLILTHSMWPQQSTIMNLMSRCPNILCDISWMHVMGVIELLCRQFGPDRVVFGLGGRVHQGAAIAALVQADVPESHLDLIAHGNMDRLLKMDPTPRQRSTLLEDPQRPLWKKILRCEPLDVDVVDGHGHMGPNGTWMVERQEVADQIPATLATMDRLGIRTFCVSGMEALHGDPVEGNRKLARFLKPHGDRFRGWIAANPYFMDKLEPLMEEFLADPFFIGFKLLSSYWGIPVTDSRHEPIWRHANKHRCPILLHTWDGAKICNPALLVDIAPRYPDAIFILGHSGGGNVGRHEAEELAQKNPNVYLEWCGSFCSSVPWEETLPKVGADRVVFGTDSVVHNFAWEMGRFLSLDLPETTLRPILGANLRKILACRR